MMSPPSYDLLNHHPHIGSHQIRRKPLSASSPFLQNTSVPVHDFNSTDTYAVPSRAQTHRQNPARLPHQPSKHAVSIAYDAVSQVWDTDTTTVHPLWTPFWLRRSVLFLYTALFACLCAALIILWRFSVRENGFHLSLTTSHYAWTYGPTAVLVLVIGLWRQVMYYCEITQAWQEMNKGPASGEQSILLDYVSPLIVSAFWTSIKYRHIPVAASIGGFLILKLVTIVSTTLLVPLPTQVEFSVALKLASAFQYRSLDETPLVDEDGFVRGYYAMTVDGPIFAGTSLGPIRAYNESLEGYTFGNNGTEGNVAFSTIQSAQTSTSFQTVSVLVPASETNANCEVANITLYPGDDDYLLFGLDTATCRVGHQNIQNSTGQLTNQTSISFDLDENFYTTPFLFNRVFCGDDINKPGHALPDPLLDLVWNASTAYTYQYALIVTNGLVNNTVDALAAVGLTNLASRNASAVLCTITYGIQSMTLKKDVATASYSIEKGSAIPTDKIANLTDLEYSEAIWSTIYAMNGPLTDETPYNPVQIGSATGSLIQWTLGKSITEPHVVDPESLRDTLVKVLNGIGTQLMSSLYTDSQSSDVAGQATKSEDRLHVRILPLWTMVGGFAALVVISLIIDYLVRSDVICHDPNSLAAHAAVLTLSPDLQKQLQGTGPLRRRQIAQRLAGLKFRTSTEHTSCIETVQYAENGQFRSGRSNNPHIEKGCWRPLPARKSMMLVAILLSVGTIAVLEVLYRLSERRNGVVSVASDSSLTSYAVRYASTTVALLLSTIFNSLDSTISIFSVFSLLQSGAVSAERSILSHLSGHLPPAAFYVAIRNRHYGAAISNVGSTLGALFTIVASGLWIYNDKNVAQLNITAQQAEPWNPQWNSNLTDNDAATVFSNVQQGLAKLPPTIWTDLVFPDVSKVNLASNDQESFSNTSLQYVLNVPALRPVLNCVIVPATGMNNSPNVDEQAADLEMWSWSEYTTAITEAENGCNQSSDGSPSIATISTECCSELISKVSNGGALILPSFYSKADYNFTAFNGDQLVPEVLNQVNGCPSLGAIWASYSYDEGTSNSAGITAIMCYQQIQQVMTKVTYVGDSQGNLTVNQTYTPIPDETTAKFLINSTTGMNSFQYNILPWMAKLNPVELDSNLDNFFNQLVYGPDAVSASNWTLPQNANQTLSAIQSLYQKYMVHVIDLNFRGTSSSSLRPRQTSTNEDLLQGTVTGATQPRLRVNWLSKILLQVLIAITTTLGCTAYFLVDMRGTLPRNPCSIASTMALFAGSEMCATSTKFGSEGEHDDTISAASLIQRWKGQKFSMGWWVDPKAPSGERFGIDVGMADGQLGLRRRDVRQRIWKGKGDGNGNGNEVDAGLMSNKRD